MPAERTPSCGLRHQRLERVEEQVAENARLSAAQAVEIAHIRTRVEGLSQAHEATLVAVRASTEASTRLAETLESVVERVDGLVTDYNVHKVDAERDRHTWPRLAIWLWGSSLTAGFSFAALIATNWSAIAAFIRRVEG